MYSLVKEIRINSTCQGINCVKYRQLYPVPERVPICILNSNTFELFLDTSTKAPKQQALICYWDLHGTRVSIIVLYAVPNVGKCAPEPVTENAAKWKISVFFGSSQLFNKRIDEKNDDVIDRYKVAFFSPFSPFYCSSCGVCTKVFNRSRISKGIRNRKETRACKGVCIEG